MIKLTSQVKKASKGAYTGACLASGDGLFHKIAPW